MSPGSPEPPGTTARPASAALVLGHRGSPREATENTLRSLDLALATGADGVEIDVQRSRDGVPVVIHDDDLARTTGTHGRVAHLDWTAIARLTHGLVPSFEQVAAWAAASGAWLNVELKAAGVEVAVLERIAATGLGERTIISSFDPAIVRRAGEVDAGIRRYLLANRWNAASERGLGQAEAMGLSLRHDSADASTLRVLRARRIPVMAWTVNDPARVRELLTAGVVAIISDDPEMAVAERDRHRGGERKRQGP